MSPFMMWAKAGITPTLLWNFSKDSHYARFSTQGSFFLSIWPRILLHRLQMGWPTHIKTMLCTVILSQQTSWSSITGRSKSRILALLCSQPVHERCRGQFLDHLNTFRQSKLLARLLMGGLMFSRLERSFMKRLLASHPLMEAISARFCIR